MTVNVLTLLIRISRTTGLGHTKAICHKAELMVNKIVEMSISPVQVSNNRMATDHSNRLVMCMEVLVFIKMTRNSSSNTEEEIAKANSSNSMIVLEHNLDPRCHKTD